MRLRNKLLAALPRETLNRLRPQLESVLLETAKKVYEPGEKIKSVYFLETAVVSHLCPMADGSVAEAAIIGDDGVVGHTAIVDTAAPEYLIQTTIGGQAMKMDQEDFRREFRRGGPMQEVLLRFLHCLISQLSQRSVCNVSHQLPERLSAWLLMVHDRAEGRGLPLTHEKIANHLGARRAGISSSCNNLRTAGAIDYRRGEIRILNRRLLEESACECYFTVQRRLTRH